MDTNNNTTQLLQAILNEVSSSKQLLGFGHPPKPRYIYANRQYTDCLWYFWNAGKNEHEPIEFHGLTGLIERLQIEEKEFKGKPDYKVNLHIRADRNYVIQAGYETLFAKGMLHTLLNSASPSRNPLVFKTVLETFASHGSSMNWYFVMYTSLPFHLRLFFCRGSVCVESEGCYIGLFHPYFGG